MSVIIAIGGPSFSKVIVKPLSFGSFVHRGIMISLLLGSKGMKIADLNKKYNCRNW